MVSVKKMIFLFFMIGSFTQVMAQLTWSSPVTLSSSTMDNSSDPQIVVDPNGNATAAWVENGFVNASFQPANGSWGTPFILSNSGASSPALGRDANGNVTAVWVEAGGSVNSSTLPLNSTWSSVMVLSAAGASSPSIAVNASGNMAAVWERSGFIEASSKLFGGAWSLVSLISPVNSDHPDVAIGNNGRVVAVWHTVLVTGAHTVESAAQIVGGVWGSAVNMLPAPSAFSMNYPKVSVDVNGNTDAVWYRYLVTNGNYSNVFVYSASLPSNSSSWSFPIQISDTGIGNPAKLSNSIATDGTGNKLAIWSLSFDGSSFTIESALKPPGGAWSSFTILENPNIYSFQGSLSSDPLGNGVAAFMFFDGTSVDIQSAETSTAGITGAPFWTAFITLSTGSDNGYPLIGANFNANTQTAYATAVWLSSNGTNTTVQAATAFKNPIAPPTNLTVAQNSNNFGVFTEYYNTVSWVASPAPNVSEYAIYRNGTLFAQVSSSTFQIVDHNAIQNGSVTYGIAAVDQDAFLSQIVNIQFP